MSSVPNSSTLLAPNFEAIPNELIGYSQWVLWRLEERGGRSTKVPYRPGGHRADITDPGHWSSFKHVVETFDNTSIYNGIGFVLTADDPFVAVDLDKCVGDDGAPVPWARGIIDEIDSYTEWSPSGAGVRIIARGELGLEGNRRGQVEVYSQDRT